MSAIKLGRVKRQLNEDKVFHDPSFSRSTKCWTKQDKNDYLQSVFNRRALTPIVLADINACKDYSEDLATNTSINYYEGLINEGYDYVALDGGHRTTLLLDFFNNRIAFSGTVSDSLGNQITFQNEFWKDIPDQYRSLFTEKEVPLMKLEDALSWELSEIFLKLNMGEPLNSHEKRQALQTPISAWIRGLASKNKSGLSRLFKEEKINRAVDHEFLAKIAMAVIRGYKAGTKFKVPCPLFAPDIDKFYRLGHKAQDFSDKHPYDMQEVGRANEIIEGVCTLWGRIGSKTKLCVRTAWFSVYCMEYLYDNNLDIQDHDDYWEKTLVLENDLITESNQAWINLQVEAMAAQQNPATAKFQKKKQDYYFYWMSRAIVASDRTKLRAAIQTAFEQQIKKLGYGHFSLISSAKTELVAA
tara:strand:+ start:188 stop:1429 length:1242 start_codon:yes stop_codon:yes gene_type:complete